MSSIAPNGQIRFLTNIPIDSNYENSLDFQNELEQRTYFLSQTPVHTQIGATRVRDGVISVNKLSDELLSANYIMFQNLNFSTKWFYAFITDVEYINNNMSYVYYQIDDIQTWMFDVQLTECFVEREHTPTDAMFEHLVDEGVNVSEYVISNNTATSEGTNADTHKYYNRWGFMLWASESVTESIDPVTQLPVYDFTNSNVQIAGGVLSGMSCVVGHLQASDGTWLSLSPSGTPSSEWNDLDKLNNLIKLYVNNEKSDDLVALIMFPYDLITVSGETIGNNPVVDYLTSPAFVSGESLNGYIPKNKKLYNSPFCLHEIVSTDGQKEILQPEYTNHSTELAFEVLTETSANPSIILVPLLYEGENYSWKKQITITDFPQSAMAIDGYMAWIASGGLDKTLISTLSGGLNAGVNIAKSSASENMYGVGTGGIDIATTIANTYTDLNLAKNLPSIIKGKQNATPITANGYLGFHFRKKCASSDLLKSIDDYFTMFGYKVNKLKQPSRRNRPHYTYLKTKGCHVNGGAPADAIQRIETIYDNGIRFWINPAEVGNYEVNNAPT